MSTAFRSRRIQGPKRNEDPWIRVGERVFRVLPSLYKTRDARDRGEILGISRGPVSALRGVLYPCRVVVRTAVPVEEKPQRRHYALYSIHTDPLGPYRRALRHSDLWQSTQDTIRYGLLPVLGIYN